MAGGEESFWCENLFCDWMIFSKNSGANRTISKINQNFLMGNLPWTTKQKRAQKIKFSPLRVVKTNTQTALKTCFPARQYQNNHMEGSRERGSPKSQSRTTLRQQLLRYANIYCPVGPQLLNPAFLPSKSLEVSLSDSYKKSELQFSVWATFWKVQEATAKGQGWGSV